MDQLRIENIKELPRIKPSIYEELPSTNSLLKELAKDGAQEGRLILAQGQSAGRGRKGKSFFSPKNTGLYMSLLLRPKAGVTVELLTAATAVAISRAVKDTLGLELAIKWVNDIYYKGKKVGGILTEGSFSRGPCPDYIIVGLGLNLYRPEEGFPQELNLAGALLEKKQEGLLNLLVKQILEEFWPFYDQLDQRHFLEEYRSRNLVLGKEVTILSKKPWTGRAIEIDDSCHLIVEDSMGQHHKLNSGELSIKVGADD